MSVSGIDAAVWSWWIDHRSEALTPAVTALTTLTTPTTITVCAVLAALVVAARTRRVWPALVLPLAVIVANLASHLLKPVIGRERPPELHRLAEETNHALPSGHATGVAALAMILTLWLGRGRAATVPARWLTGVAWVLAVAVSLTRLYLGVHWLTDILAGLLLGAAVAAVTWWLFRRAVGDCLAARHPGEGADHGGPGRVLSAVHRPHPGDNGVMPREPRRGSRHRHG
ncbi:phosphatase PAP2 family protein [Corynebacterium halotolerans]|uniref:Phosphatidic acid phosphatase type 2/haloperoxidase domain-containing protein n=1 Tax=Corynebacterium halotolerans YIM 70093 = DSM 44683 TaxID=1121362 RepID=M1PAC2_9CORY|nr:phosphatase PAP2 family protein [Corynebacterium halotolerans]AGF73626.1 hypothetical protein A605_13150 [Corynebacterium halotolerans YIM 70093 = DSM 44683]